MLLMWYGRIQVLLATLGLICVPLSRALDEPDSATPPWERMGFIRHERANEISGLAPSRLRDDVYWVMNDGGSPPIIIGVDEKGESVGYIHVTLIDNVDWEDMTSFTMAGRAYLAIADFGDNFAKRHDCVIRIVPEPELTDDPAKRQFIAPAWSVAFRYPEGPRDAESLAVDVEEGLLYILSKRATPPTLYTIPLQPADDAVQIAKPVALMTAIKEPLRREDTFFPDQPTAMDFSPDGSRLAVLTYQGLYFFHRSEDVSWAETIEQSVEPWPLPPLFQAEAVCFSVDGDFLYVTSERLPAPFYRWQLAPNVSHPQKE